MMDEEFDEILERTAAWEVQDLMWDWQTGTERAAEQLDAIAGRLDAHIAKRGGE